MNFTREPIIETIISANDGYKLSIKNSKSVNGEEYLVDAVEVVSFGGSFFYRCQERPKTFFLPSGDFEILEVKETRILIKNPNIDRNIKIAGGKETTKGAKTDESAKVLDQKRDKKKGRRNKPRTAEPVTPSATNPADPANPIKPQVSNAVDAKNVKETKPSDYKNKTVEEKPKPTVFSHLLTPPTGLISDSLMKYTQNEEVPETLKIETKSEKPVKKGRVPAKKEKEATPVKDKPLPKAETPVSAEKEIKPVLEKEVKAESVTSEAPKPGERLEEKEVNAEPFVKVPSEDERK